MTTCPVCDMKVDEKNAPARSSYRAKTYYFCSEECKETFDANPQKYVKQPATTS